MKKDFAYAYAIMFLKSPGEQKNSSLVPGASNTAVKAGIWS